MSLSALGLLLAPLVMTVWVLRRQGPAQGCCSCEACHDQQAEIERPLL